MWIRAQAHEIKMPSQVDLNLVITPLSIRNPIIKIMWECTMEGKNCREHWCLNTGTIRNKTAQGNQSGFGLVNKLLMYSTSTE